MENISAIIANAFTDTCRSLALDAEADSEALRYALTRLLDEGLECIGVNQLNEVETRDYVRGLVLDCITEVHASYGVG